MYNVVDTPSFTALSSYRIDMKTYNHREHAAIEWLRGAGDGNTPLLGDMYGMLYYNLASYYKRGTFPSDYEQISKNAYIYLRTWNIEKNEAVFMIQYGEQIRFQHVSFEALPKLSALLSNQNLIYNNGGAKVFVKDNLGDTN